jgi:hypothetical protein
VQGKKDAIYIAFILLLRFGFTGAVLGGLFAAGANLVLDGLAAFLAGGTSACLAHCYTLPFLSKTR